VSALYNRALTVDDFRGISISPAVSKLFEHAVLNWFAHYCVTSDNQLEWLYLSFLSFTGWCAPGWSFISCSVCNIYRQCCWLVLAVIFFSVCVSTFLYADDILLIAPSVCSLQTLLDACDEELTCLDVQINTKKSVCIGIGARYNTECARLSLAQGGLLQWVSQCRYLGVYVLSGRAFRCSYDHNKCQYFKAFNAIFLQSWTLCLWGGST